MSDSIKQVYFSCQRLAERWGVTRVYVRSEIMANRLRAVRLGRLLRVRADDADRFEAGFLMASPADVLANSRWSDDDGFVYFVQTGADGPIKIGWTRKPDLRVKTLQKYSSAPLRLLALVHGSLWAEKKLHGHFSDLRQHGEWFAPPNRILALLESLSSRKATSNEMP